jgi:hypothetical protein
MVTKKNNTDVRTTLYLPRDLHSQLKIEAVKRGSSMTRLLIESIKKELEPSNGK